MKRLLIVVLFLSFSCLPYSINLYLKDAHIENNFKKYIEKIKKELNKDSLGVNIYLRTIPSDQNWAGKCWFVFDTIVINKKLWKKYTDQQRLFLLYHEIGHCRYHLLHEPEPTSIWYRKTPLSIMSPSIPHPLYLTERKMNKIIKKFKHKIQN